jgi:hypothetical protein
MFWECLIFIGMLGFIRLSVVVLNVLCACSSVQKYPFFFVNFEFVENVLNDATDECHSQFFILS